MFLPIFFILTKISTSCSMFFENLGKKNGLLFFKIQVSGFKNKTGDLGFIYDQNALWNNNLSKKLKIIVINNQGGGIFKIIPGPSKTPYLNEFFETSHNLNIEKISSGFGVNYKKVDNIKEAESAIEDLLASNHSEILELFTGNVNNEEILFEYFDNIKK